MEVQQTVLWIIRDQKGKLLGPYSTEAIIKMIEEGVIVGSEQISKYPIEQWVSISKESVFYEKLLESLEGPIYKPSSGKKESAQDLKKSEKNNITNKPSDRSSSNYKNSDNQNPTNSEDYQKQIAETVIIPQNTRLVKTKANVLDHDPISNTTPRTYENPGIVDKSKRAGTKSFDPNKKIESQVKTNYNVVELDNLKAEKQKNIRSAFLPILFVFGALLVMAYVFFEEEPVVNDGKIQLIAPLAKGEKLAPDVIKQYFADAIQLYIAHKTESYLQAQNKLVRVIEANPQNAEMRSMLCLVYKELWPYTRQDSEDLKKISYLSQSTKALDPIGMHGGLCEAVKMITMGRFKESRGIIENILNNESFAGSPILYGFKGELLFDDKEYDNSIAYLDKAIQLWPQWILPQIITAEIYFKKKQLSEAVTVLKNILTKYPDHKQAMILLGMVTYLGYKDTELGLNNLSQATANPSLVPSSLEAQAHFYLSEIYIERKEKEKALLEAQKALSFDPTNAQIKDMIVKLGGSQLSNGKNIKNYSKALYQGDQYARSGDHLAAQAEYKAAFDLDPTNAMAAVKAAKSLWQLHQSTEAIEYLNKAIKVDAKLIIAYALLADYYSERFNYLEASKVLNTGIQINPNSYEILRSYALVEFRRNNFPSAIQFGLKAQKLNDTDIDTAIILAKSYLGQKEFKDAFKQAVKAVELDSTNVESQIVYSKVLSQFQGVESAIVYVKELISKYAYSYEYRIALAEILMNEERFKQAAEIYEQVIVIDTKNKKAHLGLADCLQQQGLVDRALKMYLSAAILDPSDAEPLFKAGILYLETDKFNQAITQFERSLRINPNYPRIYYYIGKAFLLSGDYQAALKATEQEKKLNPNIADPYLLAAEVYTAQKQFQKCAGEYQQALKLRQQGAEIYVKLARCYRQSANLDIAESMLNIAANKESGYADIYKEKGALYQQRGDFRSAVEAYYKYLGLSPNAPDKEEIERVINNIGK